MYIFKEYTNEQDWINQILLSIQKKLDLLKCQDLINIGLSGGSTPYPIYKNFFKINVDWKKLSLISVDERFVIENSIYSNWKKIQESIGEDILSKIKSSVNLEYYKDDIKKSISKLEEKLPNKINICILGMGEDGHFASLFPNNEYLKETTPNVIKTEAPNYLDIKERVSLSSKYIMESDYLTLVLRGKSKKNTLHKLFDRDKDCNKFPAKILLEHKNFEIHYLYI